MWTLISLLYLLAFFAHGECKKKACVIGAGGGGLAMIKEFAAYPNDFEPIAFERNSEVGGLWIYTDSGDFDQHGLPVHSIIYKNLRTNSPKQLMHFQDFQPITGKENRTCAKHETILEYLRNYTEYYDLRQYVKFDTLVEKVKPILVDENDWRTTKWQVETKDLMKNISEVTICDAVIICTGRNVKPNIPKIPGIESFLGRTLHSRSYRKPEDFANQTVIILGAGFSGIDITIDLSPYAKKVYLSHRHDRFDSELPDNVEQIRGVVSYNDNKFILQDNTTISGVDTFIYCTGYNYDVPFIDESSGIVVENKRVHPIYKQMVNARYPTMGIFGLPHGGGVLYFSIYYVQAKYYAALLRGKVQLPSLEDRLKSAELPAGVPANKAHEFRNRDQWIYYEELSRAAGFENLPGYYEEALTLWYANTRVDPFYFKQSELEFKDGEFEILYPRGKGPLFSLL